MCYREAKQLLQLGSIEAIRILNQFKDRNLNLQETLCLFDCLFADYLMIERCIDVEIWRAKCFMYGL
jgi:hypothetical protein